MGGPWVIDQNECGNLPTMCYFYSWKCPRDGLLGGLLDGALEWLINRVLGGPMDGSVGGQMDG